MRCVICGGDHNSILCPVRLGIFGEGKMNKVVEEIREALTPHPVEGFTALCFPVPTLEQVQRLIAEVKRLNRELANAEDGAAQLMRNEEAAQAELSRLTLSAAESQREADLMLDQLHTAER